MHPTRLRNNCSSLNAYLFDNHVRENPSCTCGQYEETAEHYFFVCPRYTRCRLVREQELHVFNIDTHFLLNGNENLIVNEIRSIFSATLKFIQSTKRFDPP